MTHYQFSDGALEVPTGWRDQSIQSFSCQVEDPDGIINLTISRDYDSAKKTPADYANEQFTKAVKTFPGMELIERVDLICAGQKTVSVCFRWTPGRAQPIIQHQTYLRRGDHFVILTMSAGAALAAMAGDHWRATLASLSLLPEDAAP